MRTRNALSTFILVAAMLSCAAASSASLTDRLEDIGADGAAVTTRVIGGVTVDLSTTGSVDLRAGTYFDSSPNAFQGAGSVTNAPLRPTNVSGTRFISTGHNFNTVQPIVFRLAIPVVGFGLTTVDLLEDGVPTSAVLTLEARDASGRVVATQTRTGPQGASGIDIDWYVSSGLPEISEVRLLSNLSYGNGYGIDDLVVLRNTSPAAFDYTIADWYGNSYFITQSAGFELSARTDIVVSALGFFDYLGDGLGEAHEVGIFDEMGVLLSSAVVPAGTTAPLDGGDFRYSSIPPLTLEAGKSYTVAAFLATQSDVIGYLDVEDLVVRPEISLDSIPARYVTPSGEGLAFPTDTALLASEFF